MGLGAAPCFSSVVLFAVRTAHLFDGVNALSDARGRGDGGSKYHRKGSVARAHIAGTLQIGSDPAVEGVCDAPRRSQRGGGRLVGNDREQSSSDFVFRLQRRRSQRVRFCVSAVPASGHRYRGRDQPTRHQETVVQLSQRRLAVFADAMGQPLRRKLAPGSIVRRASSKPSQRPVSGYHAL